MQKSKAKGSEEDDAPATKSERLWQHKPTQVAPQQNDIKKVAEYTDSEGRVYSQWQPGQPTTKYLDDYVKEQLEVESKTAVALFVALHGAEEFPEPGDSVVLRAKDKEKEKKDWKITIIEVHNAAPPYKRARKSALVTAESH